VTQKNRSSRQQSLSNAIRYNTGTIFSTGFSISQRDVARRCALFVDYQGGRKGALALTSHLFCMTPRLDLPPEIRQQLLYHYLDALGLTSKIDATRFSGTTTPMFMCVFCSPGGSASRILRTSRHFLQSVPYALKTFAGFCITRILRLKLQL